MAQACAQAWGGVPGQEGTRVSGSLGELRREEGSGWLQGPLSQGKQGQGGRVSPGSTGAHCCPMESTGVHPVLILTE